MELSQWKQMLNEAASLWEENAADLSRIDAEIGDGDHGITIGMIANVIRQKTAEAADSPAAMFEDMAWAVTNVQGGSAAPLFGTFFLGMSEVMSDPDASAAKVFRGGLNELFTISQAREGDKTMMDALIPAVLAMEAADNDADALASGAAAAQAGAEQTAAYVAKFGRAKNYGKKSLGHKDAGACSAALMLKGMSRGYQAISRNN